MKFHKAILIGQTQTSASFQSPGVISASGVLVGDVRLTTSSIDFYDSASGGFVNLIADRGDGSYLLTSSIKNFPLEVSRSAASLGFGSGGGSGGDTFPYTGDAEIRGTLEIEKTSGFTNDLLLIKGDSNEGEVKVNQQGILQLDWNGVAPPNAIEGGLYYTQSALYVGI